MELQHARDKADLFLKILLMCAILVGGVWGFYQFWTTNIAPSNTVQIRVSVESQPYSANAQLLLIHVKPKNAGKLRISPGKKGLVVIARSIPSDAKEGVLELDRLPKGYRVNLAKRFFDGYNLEPGVEYEEVLVLIVPKGAIYAIKATLDLEDNSEVEHVAIVSTKAE